MNPRKPAAQRGVFAILFAVLLVVILALAGLAIDMGFVYERYGDMKNYANTAALAAARQLDGTAAGVANAVDEAEDSVGANRWGVDDSEADWNEAALTFAASADGPWQDAGSVLGLPADEIRRFRYARVDASLLDSTMATVVRFFPYLAPSENQLASVVSVAGPVMAQILPLAVCALSEVPQGQRSVELPATPELIEYGFRRGVSYNLLQLNPGGSTPANYLVNPVDFPDAGSADSYNFTHAAVAPFVCAGSIAQPRTDQVFVQQPFPTSLIPELNSRFGRPSTCVASAALPDRNVKEFLNASWLNNNGRTIAYAESRTTVGNRLVTLADLDPTNPDDLVPGAPPRTKTQYGTLWAFARPVRYSATAPGHAGAAFRASDIDNLYPVDSTNVLGTTWGDGSVLPYTSSNAAVYQSPGGTMLRHRRILHVPLLDCPVSSGPATVLAVGKFMMTVAADDDAANPSITAEFGGLDPAIGIPAEVRLYQ